MVADGLLGEVAVLRVAQLTAEFLVEVRLDAHDRDIEDVDAGARGGVFESMVNTAIGFLGPEFVNQGRDEGESPASEQLLILAKGRR